MKPSKPLGPEAVFRTGKHVVGISGGKDSVALALLLKTEFPHIPFEFVITPTGDELPIMEDHWRNLEKRLGIRLKRLPCPSLDETIAANKALPNWRMRFCTRQIKIEPFMDYMDSLPADSVLYVGLRVDEEDRTGLQPPEDDTYQIAFPFQWEQFRWGLADVLEFLRINEIEIPWRTDCGKCFLQTLYEWYRLYVDHPERYVDAAMMELKIGYTLRSAKRDSWPARLLDLSFEFESGRIPKQRKKRSALAACPWCAK